MILALFSLLQAEPHWTVTVDPLTTAIGLLHVQVERDLGPHFSLYLSPSVRVFDGILPNFNGPYVGLGVEAGFRGFFVGRAPEGGWVMVRGVLARLSTEDKANPGGYTSALVGYTGILGPGLVLSGGAGVSYFAYGVQDYGIHGFAPALHTNIGWAF
jgi:hypothetical protein